MSIIMSTSRGPHSYDRLRDVPVKRENVGGVATGLRGIMESMGGEMGMLGRRHHGLPFSA